MKKAIIASTSTLHDGKYLEYLFPELEWLFQNCQKIIFIPFARPGGLTHDEYTDKVRTVFQKMNIEVQGLHEFDNPAKSSKRCPRNFYRWR
jgi:dipeptidase E